MNAYVMRHAPAAFMFKAGTWLQVAARKMDAWLAARAKAREDGLALEAMSDRELRDIGIDPARVHPMPMTRDWTT